MVFVVLCPGAPEGSLAVVLVLKRPQLKVSSDRLVHASLPSADFFFKIDLFKIFFFIYFIFEYYFWNTISVKQFIFRSGQTFCRV